MKRLSVVLFIVLFGTQLFAQTKDVAKIKTFPKGKGYYYETIMKDVSHVDDSLNATPPETHIIMEQSNHRLPDKIALYKKIWANPTRSQGNTGTCWDFSTTSFIEAEIYRTSHKKVKLSEMYIDYHEYLLKAARFIEKRGNSVFGEGSEANAVTRVAKRFGLMPEKELTGLINGHQFYDHSKMFQEMQNFLNSLKTSNAWNEKEALATIASILQHYMGVPPASFTVDGKKYTPMSYMKDYLNFHPDNYVDIISYKQKPYWQQVEYTVPDNWWHDSTYYNVPLDVYMSILKKAIHDGYSASIGGDVSEPGLSRTTQCALVPDFDIPSQYIDDDARSFRFDNGSTTDDHGMHLIGYLKNPKEYGQDWYLIKDSSSGSRNNDVKAPEFGYYFFSSDYIKLKMMDFMISKDAVKDILKKFN